MGVWWLCLHTSRALAAEAGHLQATQGHQHLGHRFGTVLPPGHHICDCLVLASTRHDDILMESLTQDATLSVPGFGPPNKPCARKVAHGHACPEHLQQYQVLCGLVISVPCDAATHQLLALLLTLLRRQRLSRRLSCTAACVPLGHSPQWSGHLRRTATYTWFCMLFRFACAAGLDARQGCTHRGKRPTQQLLVKSCTVHANQAQGLWPCHYSWICRCRCQRLTPACHRVHNYWHSHAAHAVLKALRCDAADCQLALPVALSQNALNHCMNSVLSSGRPLISLATSTCCKDR